MKTLPSHYFLALSLLFQSLACRNRDCIECGVPVEAALVISDTKGRPLKNWNAHLKGYVSGQTQQTDENGTVRFDFLWNNAVLDINSCWAIYPEESYNFSRASVLLSPYAHSELQGKITISDTLFMDSLTTFRVRARTSRTDVKQLNFNIKRDGFLFDADKFSGTSGFSGAQPNANGPEYFLRQTVAASFLDFKHSTSTPKLDTTIEVKVPANTGFKVGCSFGYQTAPASPYKLITIGATASRDSVLLIQF